MTPALARRLIRAQMPDLAGLPLRRAGAGGTDHAIFRLGPALSARFPRTEGAAGQAAGVARWLPQLAPHLPLAVPAVRQIGKPGEGYPFPWSVETWLPGRDALDRPPDPQAAGAVLAGLVASLQARPVPAGAPLRGDAGRLAPRDAFLRRMIAAFDGEADPARLTAVWETCLALPEWTGRPVWVHGDLHPLNLLVRRGRLTAAIDWGLLGAGDPAEDMLPAWAVLDAAGRAAFRATLAPDPETWARGRALAFSKAVMAVPYYRHTNTRLRAVMLGVLAACLDGSA